MTVVEGTLAVPAQFYFLARIGFSRRNFATLSSPFSLGNALFDSPNNLSPRF